MLTLIWKEQSNVIHSALLTKSPHFNASSCCMCFNTVCASLLPTVKLIGDHRLGAGLKLPVQPNLVYVVFVITSWISTSHRDSSFNQRMLKWSKCLTTTSLLISVSVSILSIKKLAVHMNPFWPWALQNLWAVLCSNKLG